MWLITCLTPLARTANLNKVKDNMGAVPPQYGTQPEKGLPENIHGVVHFRHPTANGRM